MYKHDHRKNLANAVRASVAFCALAAVSGGAAQAQVSFVTDPSQLGNIVLTTPYPSGTFAGIVPMTFSVPTTDNSNTLSFTATNGLPASNGQVSLGFESFRADASVAPEFNGAELEDTTYISPDGSGNKASAPVLIQFQTAVAGFGLYAEDTNADFETFTLNVFSDQNATVSLGSFTYPATDNRSPAGAAVFVGALSNLGPLIKSATLSSFSVATGQNPNNGSNDFYIGPTRVKAPVPEASTVVSFGMGVVLFAGLALVARRRKAGAAMPAAPQMVG